MSGCHQVEGQSTTRESGETGAANLKRKRWQPRSAPALWSERQYSNRLFRRRMQTERLPRLQGWLPVSCSLLTPKSSRDGGRGSLVVEVFDSKFCVADDPGI